MIKRYCIRTYGIVQGIGFRPFVSRTAAKYGVAGDVCNKGSYVEIHAEGEEKALLSFRRALTEDAPAVSAIIRVETAEENPAGDREFRIIRSRHEAGEIFVSPDLAICPKCSKELFDPENRRYLHPFINCTDCGPRLTILDSMPYDRVRTSMGEFPMCPDCEYEYTHASTRRFHAQPVCCNSCGPGLFIPGREEKDGEALIYVRKVLREGGIAAVKGIGGFHLCCNALDENAVQRLRSLKHRPMKPFAVMMKDMDTVRRECTLEPGEEKILTGVQKPILILKRRLHKDLPEDAEGRHLCEAVAPLNPTVGVMLPYAPVQLLLFSYPDGKEMTDAFIMTSGNPSGAPICRDDEEALRYLSPMCDVILTNNRKIRLRADDSVMQFFSGRPYMVRRSRGYAPLPFKGPEGMHGSVLAVGGELKNTFCLAKEELYYPSPYIGDLADVRSVKALKEAAERMETLLEIRPQAVACDLHPRYNSTAFAESLGLPVVYVQHHYAHILSCMAENEVTEEVIGISFDGTGYGTDGTIWGGEFLAASCSGFRRLGSIAPFRQAGGDLASREGWRVAVSLLYDAFLERCGDKSAARQELQKEAAFLHLCSEKDLKAQFFMLDGGVNTVISTSAGRLFDAASAILGIRRASTFEGEASMALEFAAAPEAPALAVPQLSESREEMRSAAGNGGERAFVLGLLPLIRALSAGMHEGVPVPELAGGFHRSLAEMIVSGAVKCRELTGLRKVALSGGVFQNLLLLHLCEELLRKEGFTCLTHSLVPPNDGGIALGQAFAAMYQLNTDGK